MHLSSKQKKIRKYRYYPDCCFFALDTWLKRMSRNGYHLVDYGIITYVFEKGKPKDREYFTYSCDRIGEGKYSIRLRYPNLDKTYGVKRKKSKLNQANVSKGVTVLEIDTNRISTEDDIGYKELIKDRNRLYLIRAIRNAVVVLLMLMMLCMILWI